MAENLLPFIMNCSQQHGDIEGAAGAAPLNRRNFFYCIFLHFKASIFCGWERCTNFVD